MEEGTHVRQVGSPDGRELNGRVVEHARHAREPTVSTPTCRAGLPNGGDGPPTSGRPRQVHDRLRTATGCPVGLTVTIRALHAVRSAHRTSMGP